jgi:hypothetical protein
VQYENIEYEFDIGEWVKPYGLESDLYTGVVTECWNEPLWGNYYEVFSEAKGSQQWRERDLYSAEEKEVQDA